MKCVGDDARSMFQAMNGRSGRTISASTPSSSRNSRTSASAGVLAVVDPAADAGPEALHVADEQHLAVLDHDARDRHHDVVLRQAVGMPLRHRRLEVGHLDRVFGAGKLPRDTRVERDGRRERARERLERGLDRWWSFSPESRRMCRFSRPCCAKDSRKCSTLSVGNSPILSALNARFDPCVAAPAEVDDHEHKRLVHRHHRVAEAGDPAPLAERLVERLPEAEPDVLDEVVRVAVDVAGRLQREVEACVLGERLEHVVEHPDAGRDLVRAGAVELERRARRSSPWSRA